MRIKLEFWCIMCDFWLLRSPKLSFKMWILESIYRHDAICAFSADHNIERKHTEMLGFELCSLLLWSGYKDTCIYDSSLGLFRRESIFFANKCETLANKRVTRELARTFRELTYSFRKKHVTFANKRVYNSRIMQNFLE